MQLGVLKLATASWCGLGPAEVVGVAGHKSPIASKDDFEQVPILDALASDPDDMRAFAMAAFMRHVRQLRAQTFIDEKLHVDVAEGLSATATLL
jgi:hypothetical protein